MKVLVIGAGESFGQALVSFLCRSDAVAAVTGIDAVPQRFGHPKFRALQLDLRELTATFDGHDALVNVMPHDAAVRPGAADAVDARVRPLHKLFQEAHAAGVRRLVHVSTAAVYGSAVHAGEHTPLRPIAGFSYAEQQAHLEKLLEIDLPHCVRLRPHVIVGPHAHPTIRRVLRQPLYPRLPQPDALFQCVHEEDLAHAVVLCLQSNARGPYNIATEDSFTLREAIRARRGFALGVPTGAAESLARFASRCFNYDLDPVWIERTSRTLLVNCRRAIAELGWRNRYSAREALATT